VRQVRVSTAAFPGSFRTSWTEEGELEDGRAWEAKGSQAKAAKATTAFIIFIRSPESLKRKFYVSKNQKENH
jgi:hypothetical protein